MRKSLLISAVVISLISIGVFAAPTFDDSVHPNFGSAQPKQELLFKKSNNSSASAGNLFFGQQGSMMNVNLSCGLRPLPPLGCQVGPCTCDQNGNNCQWTFICR